MTTRSPLAAACFFGASSQRLFELASCLICSSIALSSASTVRRSSDVVDLRSGNIGQRFEANRNLGILARLITLFELDLRLECGADVLLRKEPLHALLHRAVQRFALQAVAMHLANEVRRDLSRAEARHADLRASRFTS